MLDPHHPHLSTCSSSTTRAAGQPHSFQPLHKHRFAFLRILAKEERGLKRNCSTWRKISNKDRVGREGCRLVALEENRVHTGIMSKLQSCLPIRERDHLQMILQISSLGSALQPPREGMDTLSHHTRKWWLQETSNPLLWPQLHQSAPRKDADGQAA